MGAPVSIAVRAELEAIYRCSWSRSFAHGLMRQNAGGGLDSADREDVLQGAWERLAARPAVLAQLPVKKAFELAFKGALAQKLWRRRSGHEELLFDDVVSTVAGPSASPRHKAELLERVLARTPPVELDPEEALLQRERVHLASLRVEAMTPAARARALRGWEQRGRSADRRALLALLADGEWHHTRELRAAAGGRFDELLRGHSIARQGRGRNGARYRLRSACTVSSGASAER